MKKIIAYSTLSQLGYMFVAAGLGAYWVALFHLAAHAFFKSVLFLGAGNVMHAMNDEINIKNMGGLQKHMPWTGTIMIIASLALSGIFPLAGFYSKDMILESAFASHHIYIWGVLWFTAGLTAFYSFRLVMYVFFGRENYKELGYHPHEAQWYVIAAMLPLAILAIVAGWGEHSFVEFITNLLPHFEGEVTSSEALFLLVVTSAIAVSGVLFAVLKFKGNNTYFSEKLKNRLCYKILANQYYLPKFYDSVIVKPYLVLSKFSWKEIDMKIIDTIVDGIASLIREGGNSSRVIQTGNLSKALKIMTSGIVILLLLSIIFGTFK